MKDYYYRLEEVYTQGLDSVATTIGIYKTLPSAKSAMRAQQIKIKSEPYPEKYSYDIVRTEFGAYDAKKEKIVLYSDYIVRISEFEDREVR